MGLTTKDRIIYEALALFSEKGYEAVSVAQIADAVGIKAPSLYKHFKSKQDIFNAIIDEVKIQYESQAASMQMDGSNADKDAGIFIHISEDDLFRMAKELFQYYLHDDFICKVRRMLIIEQYHNVQLAAFYKQQFIEAPILYQSAAFDILIKNGIIKPGNAKMTAIHFYAPIFLMLSICDNEPDREKEALELIKQHIKEFNSLYRNK